MSQGRRVEIQQRESGRLRKRRPTRTSPLRPITDLPDWSSVPHTNSALLNAIAMGAALAAAASYNKEKVRIELRYEQPDRPFMKGKKKEIGFFIAYKK